MSKRWVSIVSGATLAFATLLNFICSVVSYLNAYRVLENDFFAIMGKNIVLLAITAIAHILLTIGAFSNKLGTPMLVGIGMWTGAILTGMVLDFVSVQDTSFENFISFAFSSFFSFVVPLLLLVMAVLTKAIKRRVTKIFFVPAIIYFALGFTSLVIQTLNMPRDFLQMFRSLYVPTAVMVFYTVAYLFLGMFIEGRGIAYEREKSLQ